MKKAQITIFVVIAIIIVASVLLLFLLRGYVFTLSAENVPEKLRPFVESYSLCFQELGEEAVQLLGQRGGYIFLPEREAGSEFLPHGNTLAFLGDEIPYWFYFSGNGFERQQIPSVSDMENHLERYIENNLDRCDPVITEFELRGFQVEKSGSSSVNVKIREEDVTIRVSMPANIQLQDTRARVTTYDLKLARAVGRSYEAAKKIMNAENSQLFLEERTIDAIFLYEQLPSTKTTLECYPRNWQLDNVKTDLQEVLANNIPFTKIKGTNYVRTDSYFEIDAGISDQQLGVNFLFIEEPFKLEINGKDTGSVKGESISQISPSFLRSFLCLSSYDFVYTLAYPVLVSIYDERSDFQFQFPFVVFVNSNQARKAADIDGLEFSGDIKNEVCDNKLATETIITFDSDANPLEDVIVNYKCINTLCEIGTTELEEGNAILTDKFPQCVNGFVVAQKEGYATAKEQFSTNIDGQSINLFLRPLNDLDVDLVLINALGSERSLRSDETAIITFLNEKDELAETLIYPEDRNVVLIDGFYNIRIQVFKEKPLSLAEQSVKKCFEVPAGGLGGFLGFKEERCDTFEIPSIDLDQVIFGGTQFDFFADVHGKSRITLYAIESEEPESIEDLNGILADISLNKNSPLFKEPEIV